MSSTERILNCAEQLFFETSPGRITMDDLARHLGVSKKTIYQHFTDRNELVTKVISRYIEMYEHRINFASKQSENVMEQINSVISYLQIFFSQVNPLIMHDIKTYHPKAWSIVQEFKSVFLVRTLETLLLKGKLQEFLRPQLDERIIARVQISLIEASLDNRLFPKVMFDTQSVQNQLMELFCYGIIC